MKTIYVIFVFLLAGYLAGAVKDSVGTHSIEWWAVTYCAVLLAGAILGDLLRKSRPKE